MDAEAFLAALQAKAATLTQVVATQEGDWIVKGFIDIYRRIYTISIDTKVVSKILELLLFPEFAAFAEEHGFELQLSPEQNFYPDLTFISKETGTKFAVDIKSTVRKNDTRVNRMTLGAFTGYFRNRNSRKNILYPYNEYAGHFVLGVIYSRSEEVADERKQYRLDDLDTIKSVVRNFLFFAQPKYKIAIDQPGSGNTKNIGSVESISDLLNGTGPFSQLPEYVYDDYWMYYLTRDMAQALELERPYRNLQTYREYKSRGADVLKAHKQEIRQIAADEAPEAEAEGE